MFVSLLFLVITTFNFAISGDEYVIPDNIDVDEILKNDRLLKNYANCLLEKAKCTSEGEKLKAAIPEALGNECAKCNEQVKESAKKIIHHVIKKLPDTWKELEAKYDPNGDYKKKYKDELEKEGITV